MKKTCCCCGKKFEYSEFFGKVEGYELTDPGNKSLNNFVCKECAAEQGITSKLSAGIHSTKSVLKKYIELHPENSEKVQERLNDIFTGSEYLKKLVVKLTAESIVEPYKRMKEEVMQELAEERYEQQIKQRKESNHNNNIEEGKSVSHVNDVDYSAFTDQQLEEKYKQFIVKKPGMMLQEGEACVFTAECISLRFKNVAVGTSRISNYLGGGRHGLLAGIGIANKVINRENISEEYPGNFFVTNKRMVCVAVKLSFEIPLTNITAMTSYSDGLTILAKGREYIVKFDGIERFKELLAVNNEIERRRVINEQAEPNVGISKSNVVSSKDVPNLIREYKALYDDGIITEEEFKRKKEQLLSANIL